MANEPKTVTIEPAKRGGDFLVAGFMDQRGLNMTDVDYHAHRNAIMEMRSRDPATARQYDRFLKEVVDTRGGTWPHQDIDNLRNSLAKHSLGLGSVTNQIGLDLRKHGYDSAYRPEVMLTVNGRQMMSGAVAAELRDAKVEGNFEIQRSQRAGTVAGKPISFSETELPKLTPQQPENRFARSEPIGTKLIKEEIVNHSRWSGLSGKMGSGLMKVGAGLATGVVAGVAAAAEPDATVKSVGLAAGDQAIPGFHAARQPDATILKTALAVGDETVPGFELGRKGQLCKMWGEWAGAGARYSTIAVGMTATGAAVAGGTITTGVGGVALGVGMAGLTALASDSAEKLGKVAGEAACEGVSSTVTKMKSTLGFTP